MLNEEDEYDQYHFPQFTEEELAAVDASLLLHFPESSTSLPQPTSATIPTIESQTYIHVQYEDALENGTSQETELEPSAEPSPFERFRRTKLFSVTDLSGPSWCEVQFDYGLRQRRNRKLENRPTSFVSREGKEIQVQKEVAARNDAVQESGKAIHKKLEKEIKADEVMIDISSAEEKFAVRLLNMLWALDCILEFGFTREMPVFGILQDHVIVGIIDEVDRTLPAATASPSRSKKTRSPSPSQSRITWFLPNTPTNSARKPTAVPSGKFHLNIIDAKTRKVNNIPTPANSYPSRIQLMLYHRLLSDLISTTYPFPFDYLWEKLDLDPKQHFTEKFKEQASQSNYTQAICLDDLARAWSQSIHQLEVTGVGDDLKLVYIRQNKSGVKQKAHFSRSKGGPVEALSLTEAQDIAQAIHASLTDVDMERAISESLVTSGKASGSNDLQSAPKVEDPSTRTSDRSNGSDGVASVPSNQVDSVEDDMIPQRLDVQSPDIIGTTVFKMDGSSLDDYLTNVLEYWHGERNPIGVSLSNVGRCFSCEYRDGCEWRAKMATELGKSKQSAKSSSESTNPWG